MGCGNKVGSISELWAVATRLVLTVSELWAVATRLVPFQNCGNMAGSDCLRNCVCGGVVLCDGVVLSVWWVGVFRIRYCRRGLSFVQIPEIRNEACCVQHVLTHFANKHTSDMTWALLT